MDDFFVKIYTDQIRDQINEAQKSYAIILKKSINNDDFDNLFSAIHHFIVHVSNVVKILQPNTKDDNDFMKYRALSIDKRYPHLPKINKRDIHIRNDFEHFDERIDYWVINSKSHNYIDKNVGNISPTQAISGINPQDSFRWFDNEKMVLYFCGQNYNLKELYDYIKGVGKVIKNINDRP